MLIPQVTFLDIAFMFPKTPQNMCPMHLQQEYGYMRDDDMDIYTRRRVCDVTRNGQRPLMHELNILRTMRVTGSVSMDHLPVTNHCETYDHVTNDVM